MTSPLAKQVPAKPGGPSPRLAPVRIKDVEELPLPFADRVLVRTPFPQPHGSDVKQIRPEIRDNIHEAVFAAAVAVTPGRRARRGCCHG